MKGKMLNRVLAVIFSLLLFLGTTVGCAKQTTTGTISQDLEVSAQTSESVDSSPSSSATDQQVVPIRWFRAGNEQDPKKDRILLQFQKSLNIDLEIVTCPWDQFPNKLNIMMSSGEQLDIVDNDPGKTVSEWAKNGLIIPFDDYLKDGKYPYVASVVNSEIFKNFKIDGKTYYKPLGLCPQQYGSLIRQDWLDNLGLEIPTTIDELYNVIKTFQNGDPDKNGKNDTYGFYVRASGIPDISSSMIFLFINHAFAIDGAPNNWVNLPDGTVTRYEISDANKQAAQFISKIIKEGLINKDWLSLKDDGAQGPESDDFAAGKYGFAPTSVPNVFDSKLKQVNPDAKLSYMPPLVGENGVPKNSGNNGGYWWGNVIPATCKNPDKVMEMMDYSLTAEGRELTEFGIQGIHFTEYTVTSSGGRNYNINKVECDKDWDTQKNGYLYPLTWGGLNYYEYAYIPIKENNFDYDKALIDTKAWLPSDMANGKFANWQTINTSYSIPSPLKNVFDDKLIGDSNKLLSIYNEGWLKAIMNPDDFDKIWNDMVKQWMDAGGKDIIVNGNVYYTANK